MTNTPEAEPFAPPPSLLDRLRPVVHIGVASVLLYAFLVVVPHAQGVPPKVALYAGSLLFALLSLIVIAIGVSWQSTAVAEGVISLVLLTGWAILGRSCGASDLGRLYLVPVASVLFLLGCLFFGKIMSRIVRERAMALPVAIVAGLADIFTVFWGPTGEALAKAPELVEKLSLAIPAAGSAVGPEGAKGLFHVATMGLGDVVFLALFLSMAVRFDFKPYRTLCAMALSAAVGIVLALSDLLNTAGMPLLPYMAAGFVLVNIREFRLSPQERRDLIIALALVAVLFAIIWAALRL